MVYTNSTFFVPPNIPVHVEPSVMIQVDATVIAGVLILLTIGSVFPIATNRRFRFNLTPSTAVGIILVPFVSSAIALFYPDYIKNSPFVDVFGLSHYALSFAIYSTIVGFSWMLFVVLVIVYAEDLGQKKITLPKEINRNRIDQKIKRMRIFKILNSKYRRRNKRRKLMVKRYKKIFKQPSKISQILSRFSQIFT